MTDPIDQHRAHLESAIRSRAAVIRDLVRSNAADSQELRRMITPTEWLIFVASMMEVPAGHMPPEADEPTPEW